MQKQHVDFVKIAKQSAIRERQKTFKGWKDELQSIIDQHNKTRINGKVASGKTQHERAMYLFKFFNDLRELGYMVEPHNLREKHIRVICKKYVDDQLSGGTIQNYITYLRAYCFWIGKTGMIRDLSEYFENPEILTRTYMATRDKSWEGNNVNKDEVFHSISTNYPYVWMQLLMCDAFGLRRKESIMIRPWLDEKDGVLHIVLGAKGGRTRSIKIENEYQQVILEKAIAFVGKTSTHLGDPSLTLEQNIRRFANVMVKYGIKKEGKGALGVTAHGLRSEFAMRAMEDRGLKNILKGGIPEKMPREQEERIRREVSEMLGHWRPQVTNAYAPPNTVKALNKIREVRAAELSKAFQSLTPGQHCKFFVEERITEEGEMIPAYTIEREYVQTINQNDKYFVQLKHEEDGQEHLLSVDRIVRIVG